MGKEAQTHAYLFLHGLKVPRAIRLSKTTELLPADGLSDPEVALEVSRTSEDAAVFLLHLPRVDSQLRIEAPDQETLGKLVWNAGWDALLLGCAFACQVGQNVESESPIEEVNGSSNLRVTNYHLHGWRAEPIEIAEADCLWLETYFIQGLELLENEVFRSSMHCLASYYWHPHPRSRLALLWAGIEALFRIESELSFRLSLSAAKFLEPTDRDAARSVFSQVKRLYKARSRAVHGAEMKGDSKAVIDESATLLQRLLRNCVETGGLPDCEELAL